MKVSNTGEVFRRLVMIGVAWVCGTHLGDPFRIFLFGFAGLVALVSVGEILHALIRRRERRRQKCGPKG